MQIVRYLHSRGVLTKVRNSAGQDIDGGCGQLRARAEQVLGRRRPLIGPEPTSPTAVGALLTDAVSVFISARKAQHRMHTLEQLERGELAGISRLDLSAGLDAFPDAIFGLADTLEVLNLSGNQLDSLPADLSRLRKLRILFCSDNPFTEVPGVSAIARSWKWSASRPIVFVICLPIPCRRLCAG